jgi:acyl carrier protein phosphodiesterase
LSGKTPEVILGNFIGDYVKGNKYERYSFNVQKGILLHRKIDAFTDSHPLVKQSSARLQSRYRKYSGVVIDLFYDHFLAANWEQYSSQSLTEYVSGVHRLFLKNYFKLPGEVKQFLPFLIKSRRLETYRHLEGIERSLNIMAGYSSLPAETDFAMQQLSLHYSDFEDEFFRFFEEIRLEVEKLLDEPILV